VSTADDLTASHHTAEIAALVAWRAASEAVDCSERLFPVAARLASVPERPPSDDGPDYPWWLDVEIEPSPPAETAAEAAAIIKEAAELTADLANASRLVSDVVCAALAAATHAWKTAGAADKASAKQVKAAAAKAVKAFKKAAKAALATDAAGKVAVEAVEAAAPLFGGAPPSGPQ
jgi:hypothetical protein